MRWYNPERWFNLTTGIIISGIIVLLVLIGTVIVGISLWNVPLAREFFPFLEISDVFPTKAIALFTGLATLGTLFLALTTIATIKNNNEREKRNREENLSRERRQRSAAEMGEVIDWAIDVAKCGLPVDILALVNAQYGLQKLQYISGTLSALLNDVGTLIAKSRYIEKLALVYEKMSSGELPKAVDAAVKRLYKQDELLRRCKEIIDNNTLNEFEGAAMQ